MPPSRRARRRPQQAPDVAIMQTSNREPAGTPNPGLLHMPHSWLHQLVHSLPPEDRLALFQTCTQLSRQVMVSSPCVSLHLHATPDWEYPSKWLRVLTHRHSPPPHVVSLLSMLAFMVPWCSRNWFCRSIAWQVPMFWLLIHAYLEFKRWTPIWQEWRGSQRFVRILSPRRSFHLIYHGTCGMPSLQHLHQQVSSLELHAYKPGGLIRHLPWQAMTSLQSLAVVDIGFKAMWHFEDAVAAGHLQRLRQLELYARDVDSPDDSLPGPDFAQAAASKLAHNLEHLATNSKDLWLRLQDFTALKSVEIGPAALQADVNKQRYAKITPSIMRQLCRHPSLRSVTLRACTLDEAWQPDTQFSCNWSTLVMDFTYPRVLAALSLASLKEIRFVSGLPLNDATIDVQQLQRVITGHSYNITCGSSSFLLGQLMLLNRQAMQLIAHFAGLHTLRLQRMFLIPDSLSQLWAGLPASVHNLEMCEAICQLEQSLWQGMPDTIHSVWLNACYIETEVLAAILRTAPAHVCSIRLTPRREVELKQWEDAGVSSNAPGYSV